MLGSSYAQVSSSQITYLDRQTTYLEHLGATPYLACLHRMFQQLYKCCSCTFSQKLKTEVKQIVRKAFLNSISKWFGSYTAVECCATSKNRANCGQLQRIGVNLSGQTTKILVVGRQKLFPSAQHVHRKLCSSYVLVTSRPNTYLDYLCVKFTFSSLCRQNGLFCYPIFKQSVLLKVIQRLTLFFETRSKKSRFS